MVELECFKERAKALEAEIEVLTEQQGSSMGADVAPGISAEEINAEIVKKNELLTALSSYIAERVRQRFDHLDLNRVSISLYEVSKTTGEVRDVFKFNYEDRPYVILSLSEKIKAGLEVSELLKKIAGINYPVFIDNGESVPVIDNVRPSGQTFTSQVVKNDSSVLRFWPLRRQAERTGRVKAVSHGWAGITRTIYMRKSRFWKQRGGVGLS